MSQITYPVTTGVAGDGSGKFTAAQVRRLYRRCYGEGITAGTGSDLAATVNAQTVTIAPGSAVVDGALWDSDANEPSTIPIPTVGTTGHRIVLRSTQSSTGTPPNQVRLTLISSANGASALPALTTVRDGTFDVRAWGLTITTAGVVTLVDERAYNNLSAITEASIGNRTINDTTLPTDDVGTIASLLSELANRIKTLTGETSWRTAPITTLRNLVQKTGDAMSGALSITKTSQATPAFDLVNFAHLRAVASGGNVPAVGFEDGTNAAALFLKNGRLHLMRADGQMLTLPVIASDGTWAGRQFYIQTTAPSDTNGIWIDNS